MTPDELRLVLIPSTRETRLLMTEGRDDRLIARLAPVTAVRHRWAAPMLLEALSLWEGRPVSVVISADAQDYLYPLGLADGLGLGLATAHFAVDVVDDEHPRPRRLRGLGDFRSARRQADGGGRR